MTALEKKMPWWQAYKGSWQCSTDISKETLLPWQCAVLERHDCQAQARVALGRLMQCVWNEGDIRLHTKANVYNTVVITLLYAWKDGTIYSCHGKRSSQFFTHCLRVLAGTEGHDEISTAEISECCQILLCSSENLGHVSVNSKFKAISDGPLWQGKELKDSEEMLSTPA